MSTTNGTGVLSWVARVYAVLVALFVLIMFGGETLGGPGSGYRMDLHDGLVFLSWAVMWIGLLVGLRYQLLGGVLVLCGVAGHYAVHFAFTGTFLRGPYFAMIAGPGLLFLLSGLLRARRRESPSV